MKLQQDFTQTDFSLFLRSFIYSSPTFALIMSVLSGSVNRYQLIKSSSHSYPIVKRHTFTVSLSSCGCLFTYDCCCFLSFHNNLLFSVISAWIVANTFFLQLLAVVASWCPIVWLKGEMSLFYVYSYSHTASVSRALYSGQQPNCLNSLAYSIQAIHIHLQSKKSNSAFLIAAMCMLSVQRCV